MSNKYQFELDVENEVHIPKMYNVIMHNDDYTSMEFVVDILIKIFHKDMTEANNIMIKVHNNGRAIAGVYTYDIAITKKSQTELMANQKGFPLKITVEEAIE